MVARRETKHAVTVEHYYLCSVNADRGIYGFGAFRKGVWVEVPRRIYDDFSNVIKARTVAGESGWQVRVTTETLEV